jgi:hypothetical protein
MRRAVSGCQLRTAARAHMPRPGRQKTRAADIRRGQGWTIWLAIRQVVGMTEDHGWATRWQLSTGRCGACCDVAVRHRGAAAHGLLDELADIPADRCRPVSVSSTCHEVAAGDAGVRLGAVSESHSVNGRSPAVETHPLDRTDVPPIVPAKQTGKVTIKPHDSLA